MPAPQPADQASTLVLEADPAPGVRVLSLNRPDALNALSIDLFRSLDQAVGRAEDDGEVRAIVITGTGSRAFSAGYDIHEMANWQDDEMLLGYLEREPMQWHIASCCKPTIAAINGLAYGGGAVLAIGCDIRIGGEQTCFKVTAAAYGGANATWSLPPIVGIGLAKEWLMTSRVVTAEEAARSGLLNQLVSPESVVPTAVDVAKAIAAKPPTGPQAIKALVNASIGRSMEAAFRSESSLMATSLRPRRAETAFAGFLEEHPSGRS